MIHGTCSIYSNRPLICRTQGLPLLYEAENGVREVDFCHLNFTAEGAVEELEEESLFPLDWMNEELVLINLAYCLEKGVADTSQRIPFRHLLLEHATQLARD